MYDYIPVSVCACVRLYIEKMYTDVNSVYVGLSDVIRSWQLCDRLFKFRHSCTEPLAEIGIITNSIPKQSLYDHTTYPY